MTQIATQPGVVADERFEIRGWNLDEKRPKANIFARNGFEVCAEKNLGSKKLAARRNVKEQGLNINAEPKIPKE